mmetsp:Transcript_21311/g.32199  ORF Transcript_21311/g.32199 Transcript_21311/m.32199 type:complete len:203 (-) Transcript_21311:2485-3093(-)
MAGGTSSGTTLVLYDIGRVYRLSIIVPTQWTQLYGGGRYDNDARRELSDPHLCVVGIQLANRLRLPSFDLLPKQWCRYIALSPCLSTVWGRNQHSDRSTRLCSTGGTQHRQRLHNTRVNTVLHSQHRHHRHGLRTRSLPPPRHDAGTRCGLFRLWTGTTRHGPSRNDLSLSRWSVGTDGLPLFGSGWIDGSLSQLRRISFPH